MPERTPEYPLLILDTASRATWVALKLGPDRLVAKSEEQDPSKTLFKLAQAVLEEGSTPLASVGSIAYCAGPGSMLGARTASMAIRTWKAIGIPAARNVFSYTSLQVGAFLASRAHGGAGWVVTDARRSSWNALRFPAAPNAAMSLLSNDELEAMNGRVVSIREFPRWTQTSAEIALLPYDPSQVFQSEAFLSLITETQDAAPVTTRSNAGIDPFPQRCWAEIDLAALERNLIAIKAALPQHVRYIAVVKADAYGHGIHQTVARLMQAGIDMYGVANVAEAATIREIGGSGWSILVLGATLQDEAPFLFEYDLIPTLSSPEEVQFLDRMAATRGATFKVHLKIDTGMGRLGIWHEDAHSLFDALAAAKHLQLDGIYTHFAHAETDMEFTERQRRRFMSAIAAVDWLEPDRLLIHADNSAGLNSFSRESAYNAVRIGLLQFGITPYAQSLFAKVPTTPIFSFKTRISLVKSLPAGTEVSYGRTCRLKRPSKVAILCAATVTGSPARSATKASPW